MLGKTDWTQYLHKIRKREVDIVFSLLPQKSFIFGLEIGAGDGYQTTLLSSYVKKLISSDLNFQRIKESLKVPGVEYKEIDADALEGKFKSNTFDFIFSSNVLEHVRDPYQVLTVTRPMLRDDGYTVHIIPNRFIKVSYLLFYYPNLALLMLDRLAGKLRGKTFFQGSGINLENNINTESQKSSRFKKFILPSVHGNYSSHTKEFIAYGRESWEKLFISAGYIVFAYAKGPAFSGYGFGLNFIGKVLESLGVSSEHIFILKKMTEFEQKTWEYTRKHLPHGSFRDQRKFVKDWLKKGKSAKAFYADFLKAIGNPRGEKVLDIGFGSGVIAKEFEKEGALVNGLETEQELADMVDKPNMHTYDGRKFPFDSNTFDYAYSTSVLEHMTYPEEVLKEIGRTLKPGGKFYLSFPNRYAPKETHTGLWFISWLPRFQSEKLDDWNLHFISFFKLRRMVRRAGLKIRFDTESRSYWKSSIKKLLAKLEIHYSILLKTIIVVLEKPNV